MSTVNQVSAENRLHNILQLGMTHGAASAKYIVEHQPKDVMITGGARPTGRHVGNGGDNFQFEFSAKDGQILAHGPTLQVPTPLHKHALSQFVSSTKYMQAAPITNLLQQKEEWADDLVAHTMNEVIRHDDSTHLLRVKPLRGTSVAMAWLSDKYQRIDSVGLMTSFLDAAKECGAVPIHSEGINGSGRYGCHTTDTWWELRVAIDQLLEIGPDEWAIYGMSLRTSDYGDGAVTLQPFLIRLVCLNGMLGTTALNTIHLGGRDDFGWSDVTMKRITDATTSKIHDVFKLRMHKDRVDATVGKLREARLRPVKDMKAIAKKLLTAGEAKDFLHMLDTAPEELVPAGNNAHRLSQALAYFATAQSDPTRVRQLQELAWTQAGMN